MAPECMLKLANGMPGQLCDGDRCAYWRVVGQLGMQAEQAGCAIQYFSLLDNGSELAGWLLSVKQRVEGDIYVA